MKELAIGLLALIAILLGGAGFGLILNTRIGMVICVAIAICALAYGLLNGGMEYVARDLAALGFNAEWGSFFSGVRRCPT